MNSRCLLNRYDSRHQAPQRLHDWPRQRKEYAACAQATVRRRPVQAGCRPRCQYRVHVVWRASCIDCKVPTPPEPRGRSPETLPRQGGKTSGYCHKRRQSSPPYRSIPARRVEGCEAARQNRARAIYNPIKRAQRTCNRNTARMRIHARD